MSEASSDLKPVIHYDEQLEALSTSGYAPLYGKVLVADAQVLGEALTERGITENIVSSLHIHYARDEKQYYLKLKHDKLQPVPINHVVIGLGGLAVASYPKSLQKKALASLEEELSAATINRSYASAQLLQKKKSLLSNPEPENTSIKNDPEDLIDNDILSATYGIYAGASANLGALMLAQSPTTTRVLLGTSVGAAVYGLSSYYNRHRKIVADNESAVSLSSASRIQSLGTPRIVSLK